MMRALVVRDYGKPPVVSEIAEPDGDPGEVLAASLNPIDVSVAKGLIPFRRPGAAAWSRSGTPPGLDATLSAAAIRGSGVTILSHANPQLPERVRAEAFARLARHAAAGELVAEYRETGLEALPAIWDDFAAGKVPTKTIVRPNE